MKRIELQSAMAITLLRFRDGGISAAEAAESLLTHMEYVVALGKKDLIDALIEGLKKP